MRQGSNVYSNTCGSPSNRSNCMGSGYMLSFLCDLVYKCSSKRAVDHDLAAAFRKGPHSHKVIKWAPGAKWLSLQALLRTCVCCRYSDLVRLLSCGLREGPPKVQNLSDPRFAPREPHTYPSIKEHALNHHVTSSQFHVRFVPSFQCTGSPCLRPRPRQTNVLACQT